jgi:hypothetical protein
MENPNIIVKELEAGIIEKLNNYANSPHTTNGGAVGRFIVKFLPKRFLINLLQAKLKIK